MNETRHTDKGMHLRSMRRRPSQMVFLSFMIALMLGATCAQPFTGPEGGQQIFDTVSKKAWLEWQATQTMLINEKNLSLIEPEARQYLSEQMERFLDNQPIDHAEGYVPPA